MEKIEGFVLNAKKLNRNLKNQDTFGRTTMQSLHGKLCVKMYESAGEPALEVIRQVFGEYGFEIGEGLKRKWHPDNLLDAASIFFALCEKSGLPYKYEMKGDVIHWSGYKCPFCLEGTHRAVCEAMMCMDVEMLRGLLALGKDDVILIIDKSLAAGDACCQGTLRLRK